MTSDLASVLTSQVYSYEISRIYVHTEGKNVVTIIANQNIFDV